MENEAEELRRRGRAEANHWFRKRHLYEPVKSNNPAQEQPETLKEGVKTGLELRGV